MMDTSQPTDAKPARRVRMGGLYRCCVAAINELPDNVPDQEGASAACAYCHSGLAFVAGAWQWAPGAAFTCPHCHMTSHNPHDARNGWCENCNAFTGENLT